MAASSSGLRRGGDLPAVTPMPMPTVVAAIHAAVDGFSTGVGPYRQFGEIQFHAAGERRSERFRAPSAFMFLWTG